MMMPRSSTPRYSKPLSLPLSWFASRFWKTPAIGFYHGESFRDSITDLAGGTWQGILTLSLLLFVVLIPFVGFGELQRRIGKDKLAQVFFHECHAQSSPAS
jgi:hypothetical protein